MVKFLRQSLLSPEFKKLYGQPLGAKVKYYWNKGWDEIPEIYAGIPFLLIGFGATVYSIVMYSNDPRPPKYHDNITIYRPNDPRVKEIRTDETLRGEKIPLWWTQ